MGKNIYVLEQGDNPDDFVDVVLNMFFPDLELDGSWIFLLETYKDKMAITPPPINKLAKLLKGQNVRNPYFSMYDITTTFKFIVEFENNFRGKFDEDRFSEYVECLMYSYIYDYVGKDRPKEEINKYLRILYDYTIHPVSKLLNMSLEYEQLNKDFWSWKVNPEENGKNTIRIKVKKKKKEKKASPKKKVVVVEEEKEVEKKIFDCYSTFDILHKFAFNFSYHCIGIDYPPVFLNKLNDSKKDYPFMVNHILNIDMINLIPYENIFIYVQNKYNEDIERRIALRYGDYNIVYLDINWINRTLNRKFFRSNPIDTNLMETSPEFENLDIYELEAIPEGKEVMVFDIDSTLVYPLTKKLLPNVEQMLKHHRKKGRGIILLSNNWSWNGRDVKNLGLDCDIFINRKHLLKDKIDAKKEGLNFIISEGYKPIAFVDNSKDYLEYAKQIGIGTVWVKDYNWWKNDQHYL